MHTGSLYWKRTMKNKAREAASKVQAATKGERTYSEKVTQVSSNGSSQTAASSSQDKTQNGTVYSSIVEKLQKLNPTKLQVHDDSLEHAGHVGAKGLRSSETHFSVYIVSDAFNGLSLVKRHQLVYTLLGQELKEGLHALRIQAKTPSEVVSE